MGDEISAKAAKVKSKLPMWARNRLVSINFERHGYCPHYTAEIEPLDIDPIRKNVVFEAYRMEDFRRQLMLYKQCCYRPGYDYMMFR